MGSFLFGLFCLLALIGLVIYTPYILIRGLAKPSKYIPDGNKKAFVVKILQVWGGGVVTFTIISAFLVPKQPNPSKQQAVVATPQVSTPTVASAIAQTKPTASQSPVKPNNKYDDIVVPYTQKTMPKLYADWGGEWIKKINAMMPQVVAKVATDPKCDSPELVDLADTKSTIKKEAVFFVDCKNGERFFVSQNDLSGNKPLKAESQQLEGEPHEYIQACRDNVQNTLQYPSSFDQEVLSTTARKMPSGNIEVIMPFNAKNGFGNEIPQTARCLITTDRKIEVTVVNR